MGSSKTFVFSGKQNHVSRLMKAFAHPARVAILEFLAKAKPYQYILDDIAKETPLALTTVFQHMQVLKKSGLIKERYKGSRVHYCFDLDAFSDLENYCEEVKKMSS
jgi:DNA-binding transcriptional ArsR family regulator